MIKRMTFKQFLFILPLLIFVGIFSLYPIVTSLMYTMFDYRTNDQQYNSFYMSQQFNEKLFAEDCDYVNYFIDADKTAEGLSEEEIAEFEEIQADVTAMYEKYKDFKIRDYGYSQFNQYVKSLKHVWVEQEGTILKAVYKG